MADTISQLKAQKWIVDVYLPSSFNVDFQERKMALTWGGQFKFDAVSIDGKIVASISTSAARTAINKKAVGKIHKIKGDALYLLNCTGAKRRILIFTERDMLQEFKRETDAGRFPEEIELLHVELTKEMMISLTEARRIASDEVTPK